jgi:RHS repeat-associated protein
MGAGQDALGSVRQTTTNTGLPLDTFSYDPWGTPQGTAPPTFGFTSELQDAGTGLVNLRARWYQPTSGRFTSRDPFAGFNEQPNTLHPYSYGANDPINQVDPSGECYKPIEWLRRWEPTNCHNLDMAISIYNHPNAKPRDRELALSYVSLWTIGHSALLLGVAASGYLVADAGIAAVAQWGSTYLAARALEQACPVAPVLSTPTPPVVSTWLRYHERLGGHTLARHVGKTGQQLIARLRTSNVPASSTFFDEEGAERMVALTISSQRPAIQAWLRQNPTYNRAFVYRGTTVIGQLVKRGSTRVEQVTNVRVVLRGDGRGGYYIRTAYPE